MLITMSRDALMHAAQVAAKFANGSDIRERACVLIQADDGKVAFSATDGDKSIRHADVAMVDDAGSALVSAKSLANMVKSLPDGPVTVEADSGSASLVGGRSRFVLPALDPRDWQGPGAFDGGKSCSLNAASLVSMVKRAAPFCAKDDPRASLNGVHVVFDGESLALESSDSYRVFRCSQPSSGDEAFDAVVSPDFLSVAAESMYGEVEVATDGSRVRLSCDATEVSCRVINAAYPDIGKMISWEPTWSVEVSTDKLSRALGRVLQVGNVKTSFQSSGGTLTIRAFEEGVGSYTEEIACDGKFTFWASARILKSCADSVDSPFATFCGQSAIRPVMFEGGSVKAMAMPIRPPEGDSE